MKLTWMGRYRNLVEAMIGMGNAYYRVYKGTQFIREHQMSPAQLQVMEYILENEDHNENMSEIAERLSISQSSFSKITNQLVKNGFLEKYYTESNRKNIIIKVSDYGKQCYEEYSHGERTDVWRRIFDRLDGLDDETVQIFADCLNELTSDIHERAAKDNPESGNDIRLIRVK